MSRSRDRSPKMKTLMTAKQARCLLEMVKMAELEDWYLPSGRDLAKRIWPDRNHNDPKVAEYAGRAANRRVEGIAKRYITFVEADGGRRRLDPDTLATEPGTAHYLVTFHSLRTTGPVDKNRLHRAIVENPGRFEYDNQKLEAIYEFATGASGYINTPMPTVPGKLGLGHSLNEQISYLKLLSQS